MSSRLLGGSDPPPGSGFDIVSPAATSAAVLLCGHPLPRVTTWQGSFTVLSDLQIGMVCVFSCTAAVHALWMISIDPVPLLCPRMRAWRRSLCSHWARMPVQAVWRWRRPRGHPTLTHYRAMGRTLTAPSHCGAREWPSLSPPVPSPPQADTHTIAMARLLFPALCELVFPLLPPLSPTA